MLDLYSIYAIICTLLYFPKIQAAFDVEIEYYERRSGRCPTAEFLETLSPVVDLPFVNEDIKRLSEFGNTLGRPQVGTLNDGIYELITKTRSGEFRLLYFFYYRNTIIITHGFQKKTRKTPRSEIKKAKDYREDYIAQKKEKGQK